MNKTNSASFMKGGRSRIKFKIGKKKIHFIKKYLKIGQEIKSQELNKMSSKTM
jgi:hypothetical protein